jgi:putative hydrolase of the HAD superfamily
MLFTTLFFDLDETLYPPATGLWEAIGSRITLYMTERMGFPPEQVVQIREKYFREYGTTLRGLQANHKVDMDDYLAFVHDVADMNHAGRVLQAVGLQGLFDGIIDIHSMAPFCKPMPEAFELALKTAGSPERTTCVLLDDQMRITRAARSLGMYTILVGKETSDDGADAALLNLTDLPGLLDGRI